MFRTAILLALLIICLPSFAQAEIGRIKRVYGDATVERGSKRLQAQAGMLLEQSDILVTGSDGRITVTFIDNSRFSTGADARVHLERFEFDEKTHEGAFEVSVEKGTIAIVSGQIATERPDAMKVKTPTSVLGVRGTRFIVQVQPVMVLLPDEDTAESDPQAPEKSSTLAVLDESGADRKVLSEPYEVAKVGTGAHFSTSTDKDSIDAEHGTLLSEMPAPPASYTLYFQSGGTELAEQSRAVFDELIEDAQSREQADILVVGHTDTVGPADGNDRLSKQRADAVRQQLIGLNIDAQRIRSSGRGERALLVPTGDNVDEPRNRRVQVIVR